MIKTKLASLVLLVSLLFSSTAALAVDPYMTRDETNKNAARCCIFVVPTAYAHRARRRGQTEGLAFAKQKC